MHQFNENKVCLCTEKGIEIVYTDTACRKFVAYGPSVVKSVVFRRKKPMSSAMVENRELVFSDKQKQLYLEAFKGLKIYSEGERKKMSPERVKSIEALNFQTQTALNRMKQEIIVEQADDLLKSVFHRDKMNIIKKMVDITRVKKYNLDFKCFHDLSALNISIKNAIDYLIGKNILPNQFWSI